jgi:hypothetical protein
MYLLQLAKHLLSHHHASLGYRANASGLAKLVLRDVIDGVTKEEADEAAREAAAALGEEAKAEANGVGGEVKEDGGKMEDEEEKEDDGEKKEDASEGGEAVLEAGIEGKDETKDEEITDAAGATKEGEAKQGGGSPVVEAPALAPASPAAVAAAAAAAAALAASTSALKTAAVAVGESQLAWPLAASLHTRLLLIERRLLFCYYQAHFHGTAGGTTNAGSGAELAVVSKGKGLGSGAQVTGLAVEGTGNLQERQGGCWMWEPWTRAELNNDPLAPERSLAKLPSRRSFPFRLLLARPEYEVVPGLGHALAVAQLEQGGAKGCRNSWIKHERQQRKTVSQCQAVLEKVLKQVERRARADEKQTSKLLMAEAKMLSAQGKELSKKRKAGEIDEKVELQRAKKAKKEEREKNRRLKLERQQWVERRRMRSDGIGQMLHGAPVKQPVSAFVFFANDYATTPAFAKAAAAFAKKDEALKTSYGEAMVKYTEDMEILEASAAEASAEAKKQAAKTDDEVKSDAKGMYKAEKAAAAAAAVPKAEAKGGGDSRPQSGFKSGSLAHANSAAAQGKDATWAESEKQAKAEAKGGPAKSKDTAKVKKVKGPPKPKKPKKAESAEKRAFHTGWAALVQASPEKKVEGNPYAKAYKSSANGGEVAVEAVSSTKEHYFALERLDYERFVLELETARWWASAKRGAIDLANHTIWNAARVGLAIKEKAEKKADKGTKAGGAGENAEGEGKSPVKSASSAEGGRNTGAAAKAGSAGSSPSSKSADRNVKGAAQSIEALLAEVVATATSAAGSAGEAGSAGGRATDTRYDSLLWVNSNVMSFSPGWASSSSTPTLSVQQIEEWSGAVTGSGFYGPADPKDAAGGVGGAGGRGAVLGGGGAVSGAGKAKKSFGRAKKVMPLEDRNNIPTQG